MEYAIYPFDYMRITQRHDKGNHLPHWNNSKNYSDKPWDEAVFDGGRQYFIPKNDFIVEEVLIPPKLTNSVRLKSVNKLKTPYKEEKDYLYITLSHMNDVSNLKKGQIIKAGSKVILEGNAPPSSGNHFHITANFGKYYGIKKNSNNVWCFTYEKSLLPNEAFYVDETVKVLNSDGYIFKTKPKEEIKILGTPVIKNIHKDQIEVLATNLRGRDSPNGKILGYVQKGVYDILESKKQGNYTWYRIGIDLWIAHSDAWSKLLPKQVIVEPEEPIIEEVINDEKEDIKEEETNTEEANEDLKGQNETLKEIIGKIINFLKSVLKRKN